LAQHIAERHQAHKIAAAGDTADREVAGGPSPALSTSPAAAPDEGPQADDADITAVLAAFDELDTRVDGTGSSPHLLSRTWLRQMADAGHPLGLTQIRSARRLAIAQAVHALTAYDDAVARAAIATVTGIAPDGTVGAAFAALEYGQAIQVAHVADALNAGAMVEHITPDGTVSLVAA
jgi:hypothetical protein